MIAVHILYFVSVIPKVLSKESYKVIMFLKIPILSSQILWSIYDDDDDDMFL
jgi:hypothetical protein